MSEREELARLLLGVVFCNGEPYPWDAIKEEWREEWRKKADRVFAAGYCREQSAPEPETSDVTRIRRTE
jgi:hypothetical protein